MEVVGVRRAECRDRPPGLGPADGRGRVRVHDPADRAETLVEQQVRWGVRRRSQLALDDRTIRE